MPNLGDTGAEAEGPRVESLAINAARTQERVGGSFRGGVDRGTDLAAEELARRRKGKEIQNLSLDGPRGGVDRVGLRIGSGLVGPSVGGGLVGTRVEGGLCGPNDGGGHAGPRVGGSRVWRNPSGSDLCDPLDCKENLNARPISSDDVDSRIGPVT